ncbi:zip homologous protein 1-like [Sitodiplosis mosellana]|uniref:zip homologous protein 1-like n=1 Tax=Sitodiplosis mosellana TaxID=263140 RepID=UPI002444EE34|nr:zip homologous protein 1-like [Sitodiplosis mosellana]
MASTTNNSIVHFCSGCSIEMTLFADTAPSTDGDSVPNSFLTKCFHVLCRKCRIKGGQQCAVCNANTRYMAISHQMPQRFRSYFDQLSQMQTQMENQANFQMSQARLIGSKFIAKRDQLKQKCVETKKMVNDSKQKCQRTQDDKHKMEIILQTIRDDNRRQADKHEQDSQPKRSQRDQWQFSPNNTQSTVHGHDNMTSEQALLDNFTAFGDKFTAPVTSAAPVMSFGSDDMFQFK